MFFNYLVKRRYSNKTSSSVIWSILRKVKHIIYVQTNLCIRPDYWLFWKARGIIWLRKLIKHLCEVIIYSYHNQASQYRNKTHLHATIVGLPLGRGGVAFHLIFGSGSHLTWSQALSLRWNIWNWTFKPSRRRTVMLPLVKRWHCFTAHFIPIFQLTKMLLKVSWDNTKWDRSLLWRHAKQRNLVLSMTLARRF